MLFFIILLLVPILIQHFSSMGFDIAHTNQKRNTNSLFFFFSLLTLLAALRHESVGNDSMTYAYIFDRCASLSWGELDNLNMEIGYLYLNKVISCFSTNPQLIFAVSALLVNLMIYPTYRRLATDSSLTIAIYISLSTFVMMFSGIRQMLAIGIGFIAYELSRKKHFALFVITVIVAISFHTSAFMLALIYPLYHLRLSKKWLVALVPTVALIFVFNRQIFTFLASILAQYTKYDSEVASTGAYTMIVLLSLFVVFCFLIPDESLIDQEIIGLRNFLLLSLLIQLFAPVHTLAMRMNYYYIIFIPLLIPKIIACRSIKWSQVAVVARHIMVIFFIVYFFYNASRGGNLNVFPYHFFWETVG